MICDDEICDLGQSRVDPTTVILNAGTGVVMGGVWGLGGVGSGPVCVFPSSGQRASNNRGKWQP